MTSPQPPAAAAAATAAGNEGDGRPRTVTIHVLSPSLPGTSRFPLHNVELDTTVGELRVRISHSFPGHPEPMTQRLIYRGRPLINDTQKLSRILSPVDENEHSIHMVLPPPSAVNSPSSTSGTGPRAQESSQFSASLPTARNAWPQNAGDGLRFRGFPTPASPHEPIGLQHVRNAANNGDPQGTGPPPPYSAGMSNPADVANFEDLSMQTDSAELSLDHGFVPPHELMYQLRARTEQLLHRQVQNQGDALYPSVHALLQRIMGLYRRIDHLPINGDNSGPLNAFQSTPQVFLATGPDGRQSLVMPATNAAIFPVNVPTLQAENIHTAHTGETPIHQGRPAGQNPGVGQDIIRQVVINQQRRREVENVPAGQYLRRIWLFIRLYFCIYMISSSGTWARVFLVAGAVLIALLSDTEIPRQIQEMLITPIQRHLEGLAQLGAPADQATQGAGTGGQNAATVQAGGNGGETIRGELWSNIRRMQRAIVLLLASLIPGIGERQVEARNAAEAEAERLRQEEQQRLQEQQQQQQQQQQAETQAEPRPEGAGDDAVRNDTTAIGEATQQPEPESQPAVPA
ncbi:hypothetical protein F1880_006124 [Penicillium rolfsii]|nr:hypothetical protein F1880_006124 [Penicillium rolfsii]